MDQKERPLSSEILIEDDKQRSSRFGEATVNTNERVLEAKKAPESEAEEKTPDDSEDKPDLIAEKLKALEERANEFMHRNREMFAFFAKDGSISFVPKAKAETFSFNAVTGEVAIPLAWFEGDQYDEDELAFAVMHELAHFTDMRQNPEGFLKNFAHMDERAKKLAKDYTASHPEHRKDEKRIERYYYRQIHTFYNCLDDVYVNRMVAEKTPYYEKHGSGRRHVVELYKKLFSNRDLTKDPKHLQMVYSLLRDSMIGQDDGECEVSDEVKEALNKPIYDGYTLKSMVFGGRTPKGRYKEPLIFPNTDKNGQFVDPMKRYNALRQAEELYISLIEEPKLDEEEEKQAGEGGGDGGEGEPSESDGNNGGDGGETSKDKSKNSKDKSENSKDESENSKDESTNSKDKDKQKESPASLDPKDMDPDEMRKLLDEINKFNKIQDLPKEERDRLKQEYEKQQFDEKHNITKEQRQKASMAERHVEAQRKEMREFWNKIIGKCIQIKMVKHKNQKKGDINIDSVISHFPELHDQMERVGHADDLPLYEQKTPERSILDQAEKIEVSLAVDCSGSMSFGMRMEVAREAAALLALSIVDFNRSLLYNRAETNSPLWASSEIIFFGKGAEIAKPAERSQEQCVGEGAMADIIRSVGSIHCNDNETDDDAALDIIIGGIAHAQARDPEYLQKVKEGKIRKIVFEVTDGMPRNRDATAERINALVAEGAIVVVFHIGNLEARADNEEYKQFLETYGACRRVILGDDVSGLPKGLMEQLSDILEK